MLGGQVEARSVARRKRLRLLVALVLGDWADGVKHALARQAEARRDRGGAGGLQRPLGGHVEATGGAEARPGRTVNGVVDAGVVRFEAPQHVLVG